MGDPMLREYTEDPIDALLGNRGKTTKISESIVRFRTKGSVLDGGDSDFKKWGKAGWWYFGLLKGDGVKLKDDLEVYRNTVGMRKKTVGSQLTGVGPVEVPLDLKNITIASRAMMLRANASISYSTYPGTRLITIALSAAIATGNTFAMTFTTTNIETGVTSSATAVNVVYASSSASTYASIVSAIEANTGILESGTGVSSDTITITARPGYYITVTVAPGVTGGTPPTVTTTETDTSIIDTTIDENNGAIDYFSFGVTSATGFTEGMLIEVLTGNSTIGTQYEYKYVSRVDTTNDVIYLNEPLSQLPEDGVAVKCVADIDYLPLGDQMPNDLELQIEIRDRSGKTVDFIYVPCASLFSKDGPYVTAEGEEGNLTFTALEQRMLIGSEYKSVPYLFKSIMSVTGTY